jgi:hypothetical protein
MMAGLFVDVPVVEPIAAAGVTVAKGLIDGKIIPDYRGRQRCRLVGGQRLRHQSVMTGTSRE